MNDAYRAEVVPFKQDGFIHDGSSSLAASGQ
jgi:hypothetical protein